MESFFIALGSFIAGLFTCKIVTKFNIGWNKAFVFFNSGKINQKNITSNDKEK